MDKHALPLEQKRFRLDAFTAHCGRIVTSEIKRRNISARELARLKIIKNRNNYRARFVEGLWGADELCSLIEYLKIDMVQAALSFISKDPDCVYNNGAFSNFSAIVTALVDEYDRSDPGNLPTMDAMREGVVNTLGKRLFDQVCAHDQIVYRARNTTPPAVPREQAAH